MIRTVADLKKALDAYPDETPVTLFYALGSSAEQWLPIQSVWNDRGQVILNIGATPSIGVHLCGCGHPQCGYCK